MVNPQETLEVSLDPQDWQVFRSLAHNMVDDIVAYLTTLRDRPAWQPMPLEIRSSFKEALPMEGEGEAKAYQDFLKRVLPYPNGNLHPCFWGWVQGTGTPLAMLAEMLAAAMNPHMAGFNQAPALVEHQVLAWLTELMGFPETSSGVLTTGGTVANLLGVAVARNEKAAFDVRKEGLQGNHPRLILYGSTETHGWAKKAVEILGLGSSSFHQVETDDKYRIDLHALRDAVEADLAKGHQPFCVIGTAGTVNTGAIDNLPALAVFCREKKLWFHIDAAFGAFARISEKLRSLVAGIEEADSLAFDLHKWMYMPFEVACVLIRDANAHHRTFSMRASYLRETNRGVIAGGLPFADRGIDLTRNFKALKVWLSLKAHGIRKFATLIEQNVLQAQYLAGLIESEPELELLTPVALNVVCFRYIVPGKSDEQLDELNQEILIRLQEEGIAVPSGTVVRNRFAIRVANVNHRSRKEDFQALAAAVVRFGRKL